VSVARAAYEIRVYVVADGAICKTFSDLIETLRAGSVESAARLPRALVPSFPFLTTKESAGMCAAMV
jgi:hypothetical protein